MNVKYFLIISFLLVNLFATAQKGFIRGTVLDDATGETLVGVNIVIKGTTTGATTDLDGKFSISIAPGAYDLQISFISYQTQTIEKVKVVDKEATVFNNIRMKESTQNLTEVVIVAKAVRTSETAIMTVKKKSATIMDGISADKMQLTGDGTAVEAAKRVTGVSIEGGKYVYVRGLGDRYSKTTLNQMDIPGLDPDRNSLQMDIFPTNLIDNIMVSKNFTADLPADFTGGLMNVETKDFPEEKILKVSFGLDYNPAMHFNSNYLTYRGGKTDFLGFDDGTRALPAGARSNTIPTPISGATREEVKNFVKSFNPILGPTQQTSFTDYSLGFSMGNQINLKQKSNGKTPKLGYIFSLSYKSEQKYYDDMDYGEFQRYIDPNEYKMRYATIQTGSVGEHNVLVGLLGGIAYKTDFSKIRLTAMRLQNGESRAGVFNIDNDGQAVGQSGYTATSYNLEYNQRSLTNILLNGTHLLNKSGWEIDWRISPTFSTSEDPDIRKTTFTHNANGDLFSPGAGGNPGRIWRSLNEFNTSAKFDVTKKYQFNKVDAKLKFGTNYTYKNRNYEILSFDVQFFGTQTVWLNPDPNTVLTDSNMYPNKPNSIYFQSGNNNPNPNTYESNINNTAFYVSNEMELLPGLKTILGVRAEYFVQRHMGRDQTYASGDTINGRNLNNQKVLESFDLFPSANFIYTLSKDQNLRLSYSRTIARPSFKELSFAQIIDPISNRIFNGSLFTYGDWDGQLVETRIDNIDFRWEIFLKRGQIFSASGFYKHFDKPIELVRIPEQQTSSEYQPRNVGNGLLYGIELEFRKDLDFISTSLSNFNINGNFTWVKSQISMTNAEYNSRKAYEKTGETVTKTRQMAGQSPYVINAGITYSNYEKGINAGIFYNVKGPTLYIVGAGLFPDIYQEPFHSLNFSINKKLGKDKKTVIDFKVSNILNDRNDIMYQSYTATNQIFESKNPGLSFGFGINYKF